MRSPLGKRERNVAHPRPIFRRACLILDQGLCGRSIYAKMPVEKRNQTPWAKDTVSFMAGRDIIAGTEGQRFSPRENAACEQALMIALRMLERLP